MHMKQISTGPKSRQFLDDLVGQGRYVFDSAEARTALGATAAKFALSRLARQGAITSPARGFYVIVPAEYRPLGCLPADQFIPALMNHLGARYYAGLLTAAQFHGAAHQRPQEFQVCVARPRRPLACGKVRVRFILRSHLPAVPVTSINTPRGSLVVSTPEATAVDLVGYPDRAGGLNIVATVLAELAEKIDSQALVAAAATAPLPWAQRLGYLLERLGAGDKAALLKAYIHTHASATVPLLARSKRARAAKRAAHGRPEARRARATERNAEWRLFINATVEPTT